MAKHNQRESDLKHAAASLDEMMKTLSPYLPRRTFESEPQKQKWERSEDSQLKAADGKDIASKVRASHVY